jgi:tRNA (guanine-N7-)-methyltransferase
MRTADPYADAPRLPEGDVDIRELVGGEWYELEIGPGRGGFLLERAEAEPRAAIVGLEVRRKWAKIVDDRLAARGLAGRARVFAEDAKACLGRLAPDCIFRRAFLSFPDPWWKKKHNKRLVLQSSIVGHLARVLAQGGELFIQTDVESRAQEYEKLLSSDAHFAPKGDSVGSPILHENPYAARSSRERRAIADGLPIIRLRFVRR